MLQVTDGTKAAFEQARQAAGGRDVLLAGGAASSSSTWPPGWSMSSRSTSCRSCSVRGARLLENVGDLKVQQVRAIEVPGVTHIKYRVINGRKGHST